MENNSKIADLRQEYQLKSLDINDVQANPLAQFTTWFEEALQSGVPEPNAMTLSTVSAEGQASGRIVLLKGLESGAFQFFTNYNSRKGQAIASNAKVGLTFFWQALERQVCIEGIAQKLEDSQSEAYFQSRPFESRLGAWTSPQSEKIESRQVLEQRFAELLQKYEGKEVPRPEHWGGYAVVPTRIEFWQGRASRLHDRIAYQKTTAGNWEIARLAP